MKKIILTKTTTIEERSVDCSNTTLFDRKSMIGNYKKLFEALFDLPDKKVVARVLDAINNAEQKHTPNIEVIEVCSKCNQKTAKVAKIDATTQTDAKNLMQQPSAANSDDSRDTPPICSPIIKTLNTPQQTLKTDDAKLATKRKRRRKTQIPQVIKKSHAQEHQKRNKPVLQKRKLKTHEDNNDIKCDTILNLNTKRQRQDSVSSSTSKISLILEPQEYEVLVAPTREEIKRYMVDEWINAQNPEENGLYPIHNAIIKNDTKSLGRQILVWTQLKHVDLNSDELLTGDDEDCLQLALVEKSSTEIVSILLSKGLDANSRDAKSNTILHLAILNGASAEILHILMDKVDIDAVSVLNYDGFTPLHLAVRQNEYMLAEALLDALDRRLLKKTYYDREQVQDEKHFLKYYESCCELSKLQEYFSVYSKEKDLLITKRKVMDAGDVCGGSTVLLYAISNKLEHLIYFLLAHFADPRAESLSGQSPTLFLNEYAKSLNLSLRIDQVMENIVSLIAK